MSKTCPHCGRDLEGGELETGLCTSEYCPRHDARPTNKAAEYFGLFLTELRLCGYNIHLSDRAAAVLLRNGIEILAPSDDDTDITIDNLCFAFEHMEEMVVDDNGSNPDAEWTPGDR
jgi:hypothetical protein